MRLFARRQADHAEIDGEDAVVGGDAPGGAGVDVDAVVVALGHIGFDNEKSGAVEFPLADLLSVRAGAQLDWMAFAGMSANAQALRTGLHANQARGGVLADPAVLVAEHAFQVVPAFEEPRGVAGQAEIDQVFSIAWI